ncbi:hypothetical protein POM88_025948 [Heracleum sosnowskyi]|uniref:ATP-dependent DNA helicase n=1 Tax=Heracleum sosnowskyi TaxID=360622 RepID=A0AAD8MNM1_9APIA|nr:hypothetical protein POM88_025948 [Heracleum sosnowskyi]
MFIQWFRANSRDPFARGLTFVEFPEKYLWDEAKKIWKRRKNKICVVGRLVYVHPTTGERLDQNMRIESGVPPVTISGQKIAFADWVISIGDGQVPTVASIEGNEPSWVEIPPELSLDPGNDGKKVIIHAIYSELSNNNDSDYFRDRAILTPLNEDVDLINKDVLKQFPDYIVAKAADTYRPISGEYVINFNRKTKIDALDDIPTIPRYKFEIETFEAARTKEGDVVTLMDVVDKLTKYTPIQTTNNGKRNVQIALTNERNETMKITLWENQAHDFLQLRTKYHEKPNIYVIVTSTTTKLVSEEHVLWSSSSTQLYFNIDHPAILALRTNSNMQADLVPENVPSLTRQIKTTTEDVEKVTIQQLFDAQLPVGKDAIAFFTEATVVAILPGCDWYYMGCSKCNKIINEVQQCSNCPNNKVPPIPIYRVTVEVEDETSVTTFVLFDRHVKKIINVSTQHILSNDKDASQDMIPPILNNMLDEQVDNDNGQNSKDDSENKRKTPEEQNGDPQPPPSSITKPSVVGEAPQPRGYNPNMINATSQAN